MSQNGLPSERILDAAIECTFPASDPIAVQSAFAAACERESETDPLVASPRPEARGR
jgi:hypothetical protein